MVDAATQFIHRFTGLCATNFKTDGVTVSLKDVFVPQKLLNNSKSPLKSSVRFKEVKEILNTK